MRYQNNESYISTNELINNNNNISNIDNSRNNQENMQ